MYHTAAYIQRKDILSIVDPGPVVGALSLLSTQQLLSGTTPVNLGWQRLCSHGPYETRKGFTVLRLQPVAMARLMAWCLARMKNVMAMSHQCRVVPTTVQFSTRTRSSIHLAVRPLHADSWSPNQTGGHTTNDLSSASIEKAINCPLLLLLQTATLHT